MSTDPRIEAAAIACYVAVQPNHRKPEGWEEVPGVWKKNYRDQATAALAAADTAATITTVEELDALPVGSVVIDRYGDAAQLSEDAGWCNAMGNGWAIEGLPARVIHWATE